VSLCDLEHSAFVYDKQDNRETEANSSQWIQMLILAAPAKTDKDPW
jgi:hypothetical protein